MMKTVLCISPHFPPNNAADMHRLRQSLPYFNEFGWRPVCFVVRSQFVEQSQENLLLSSLPSNVEIHYVDAFSAEWTRKVGLGNLGFRSILQYRNAVNKYLASNDVDLIYFTTTVFTLMSLGPYWKNEFDIPFVIDMQDPWRNDYYLSIPKRERPRKFLFDYCQKKILEAYTIPKTGGIISVSDGYVSTLKKRYPSLEKMKCLTLPFGFLEEDLEVAKSVPPMKLDSSFINIVYVGRGGNDMSFSIGALFSAFSRGLDNNVKNFSIIRFHFIGTSYAKEGKGVKTIFPIAKQYAVEEYVSEITDRLPYYQSLSTLLSADVLFVPGSTDSNYTASKMLPYLLTRKPLLSVFHKNSGVVPIIESTCGGEIVTFSNEKDGSLVENEIFSRLKKIIRQLPYKTKLDIDTLSPLCAREMTRKQCMYFDGVTL